MTTTEVWEMYADDVKRLIMSKVKDAQITDDLVQEVFIKVHTKLTTVKDERKVKSWLLSVSRNTVLDYYRKSNKEVPLEQEETIISEESYTHSEKDCLPGIIKNLPKKYRNPLLLSDIKGLKQAEIAAQLKLPLATVKSQIQRGRRLIVQGYMECCDYKLNDKGFLTGEVKDKKQCKVCN
ncbi:sigma-70 family RNA polymerase sigma factor [Kordia algicida OT-1]|uniref:RNA polymerase sigma-70 factor n=1 Tax=Kordia algicida OT-1 TaxID=391587 RepID=A9E8X6_9FLAO|nr:sigma-70 family RNA polymerase sigma factor [Kordia algicida]EDP94829.1 RNA polymerase sigma-70 factor [Kordia algicida OT-1]